MNGSFQADHLENASEMLYSIQAISSIMLLVNPGPPYFDHELLLLLVCAYVASQQTGILQALSRLVLARKLTTSRQMLLWMAPSEAPKALQASIQPSPGAPG